MSTATATEPKSRSILDITDDLQALQALLEEVGGDITGEQTEAAINAWLDEAKANKAAKVEQYCRLIRLFELHGAAIKAEMDRLKKRAEVKANAQESLRARLKWAMEQWGDSKIDAGSFLVSIAKVGGKAPLKITDESIIPEEYGVRTWVLSKDSVREALENGRKVPGCELGERGTTLKIK